MDSSFWLRSLGRLQATECTAPQCVCPHALLFVWPVGREHCYELQLRKGGRHRGGAKTERDALRFAAATLLDLGGDRMWVVHGRPVEVPNA